MMFRHHLHVLATRQFELWQFIRNLAAGGFPSEHAVTRLVRKQWISTQYHVSLSQKT
jgi:hypothetical protein